MKSREELQKQIEETNRILTSSISDINFANHANNKKNLIKENITGKIYITGSTVYSSLLNQGLIDEDTKSEDYILITLHRPINVDNIDKLNKLLKDKYSNMPFVRVQSQNKLSNVVGSNYCDISISIKDNQNFVVETCIDNLIKGGAGQAIQNMNLKFGYKISEGLL